ncbi:MAG: hypothetical protein K9G48_12650 [Reyranella sp.]|nr:hypothetical protein [Reyranella sp.]
MKSAAQLRALASTTHRLDDYSTAVDVRIRSGEVVAMLQTDEVLGWANMEPGEYRIDVPGIMSRDKPVKFPIFICTLKRQYVRDVPKNVKAAGDYLAVPATGGRA